MTRDTAGFTLLEALVAVAVLGLVLVLLNQGVAFGLRATETRERRTDASGEMPAAETVLRSLLADADPGTYPEPAPFDGSASAVSWITTLPMADGVRRRVDATLSVRNGQLVLKWIQRRHVQRFGPPPPPHEAVLVSGIRSLRLGYFGKAGQGWQETWSADTLPSLVKLDLAFSRPGRGWPPILVATARQPLEQ